MDNSSGNVHAFEEHHRVSIPDYWERGRSLVGLVLDAHDRTCARTMMALEPGFGAGMKASVSHLDNLQNSDARGVVWMVMGTRRQRV